MRLRHGPATVTGSTTPPLTTPLGNREGERTPGVRRPLDSCHHYDPRGRDRWRNEPVPYWLRSAHLQCPGDGRFFLQRCVSLLLLVSASILSACRPVPPGAGSRIFVDDAGDTVHLVASAHRVVSLSPATTELLFAIGAGDRVAGRTRWCDYPAEALAVADVGDAMPPNVEAVLARHPDLVLLYRSPQNAAAAARFRAVGIPAIQLANDRLSDVPRTARLLGPLVERAEAAESLAVAFERELAAATVGDTSSPNRPSLLLLPWDQPPIAIGGGSFQSELVIRAGGRNIFADLSVPSGTVSIEAIMSRDPDFLLINDSVVPGLARRPEWQVVPAVRKRRFLLLRNNAFGRPSPRAPQVLRELRALIDSAPR